MSFWKGVGTVLGNTPEAVLVVFWCNGGIPGITDDCRRRNSQTLASNSKTSGREYGERPIIFYGLLEGRLVVVGYVERGAFRYFFSMRKANEREIKRIQSLLGRRY